MKKPSIKEILKAGVSAIKADPRGKDTFESRVVRAEKNYSAKKNKGATVVSKLREAMRAAANLDEFDNNIHDYSDAMCVVNKLLMKRELVAKSIGIKKKRKLAKV
ncbi:hypothetical protein GW791_00710 [Candidatus Saccharibacteria bacterium]|nr:hypothetical protein [Candidatus Saccharibacteria bacterium]